METNAPTFVTKDDAREAQRAEAEVYGGQNPRGGMAAQMQVSHGDSSSVHSVYNNFMISN